MTTQNLKTPIRSVDAIRSVNFFNGRLLSGEDLTQEQRAQAEERRQLGLALGEGVAQGLEVTASSGAAVPTVHITAGMAINRRGVALTLADDVDLTLSYSSEDASTSTGLFEPCNGIQVSAQLTGTDVYLLMVCPASLSEGRAPVSGLGNIDAGCNTRYNVETVQFRLVSLGVSAADLNAPLLLRNRVAYGCYEAESTTSLSDLFSTPSPSSSYLATLRKNGKLTECDVPLAAIHWTASAGIQFVDMHAVRRRLHSRQGSNRWETLYSEDRLAEREAAFLQFQDHVQDLRFDQANPGGLRSADYFRYLPAAGILPVAATRWPIGYTDSAFFAGMTIRNELTNAPNIIEGTRLETLLRESFQYPAIDLQSKVLLWVYRIRENRQAIDQSPLSAPQEYMVFTSGHMPYSGDARYDVNLWAYSNFA